MANQYFEYGTKELEYIKSKDAKLAAVIDKIAIPNSCMRFGRYLLPYYGIH